MSARTASHHRAVALVARRLRATGVTVTILDPMRSHGVALVGILPDGVTVHVAVRASTRQLRNIQVTTPSGTYRYRVWQYVFNLHAHGTRTTQADWWVLVPLDAPAQAWLLPSRIVGPTRQTYTIVADVARPRNVLHAYRGRWGIVAGHEGKDRARGKAA